MESSNSGVHTKTCPNCFQQYSDDGSEIVCPFCGYSEFDIDMMMVCPGCGREFQPLDDSPMCPFCGYDDFEEASGGDETDDGEEYIEPDEIVCPGCGREFLRLDDSPMCPFCGYDDFEEASGGDETDDGEEYIEPDEIVCPGCGREFLRLDDSPMCPFCGYDDFGEEEPSDLAETSDFPEIFDQADVFGQADVIMQAGLFGKTGKFEQDEILGMHSEYDDAEEYDETEDYDETEEYGEAETNDEAEESREFDAANADDDSVYVFSTISILEEEEASADDDVKTCDVILSQNMEDSQPEKEADPDLADWLGEECEDFDRCLTCMEKLVPGAKFCQFCGSEQSNVPERGNQLPLGYVLSGRYVVGKVIGSGGFGITYIGWDSTLQRKIAIKEYMPTDFATRVPGNSMLTVFTDDKAMQFENGKNRFIEEGRMLAGCNNIAGIVKIYDVFSESGTAYLVMEYLDGETLKSRLKRD